MGKAGVPLLKNDAVKKAYKELGKALKANDVVKVREALAVISKEFN